MWRFRATIEVFQQQQQKFEYLQDRKQGSGYEFDDCNVWLIAPLISKLSSQVSSFFMKYYSVFVF